jgi:hypothetical protein
VERRTERILSLFCFWAATQQQQGNNITGIKFATVVYGIYCLPVDCLDSGKCVIL